VGLGGHDVGAPCFVVDDVRCCLHRRRHGRASPRSNDRGCRPLDAPGLRNGTIARAPPGISTARGGASPRSTATVLRVTSTRVPIGVRRMGQLKPSWASSPREVTPTLAKTLRR
jgi:hypothetical protein